VKNKSQPARAQAGKKYEEKSNMKKIHILKQNINIGYTQRLRRYFK
jgi:hypothetical protein